MLKNSLSDQLPEKPSEVRGYWPIEGDRRIPAIKRRAVLAKIFMVVIPLAVAGAFIIDWPEWMEDIMKLSPIGIDWIQLAFILVGLGLTILCFNFTFGGWQAEHERVWREVQDGNIALIAQHVCSILAPGETWHWLRPGNWGDGYLVVVGGQNLVLVNLTTDWMIYAGAGYVSEVYYNCRHIGSVTHSQTNAQTYGGGYYAYAAQTYAQTNGQTVDVYEHIIDLYTSIPGNEHLSAHFGGNESLAKEAYAMLLPLTRLGKPHA